MHVSHVQRIAGALLFTPKPYVDERGFFSRAFDADVAREAGIDPAGFTQDSVSRSVRGVVRGMHLRGGDGESKLVRCSYGAVFDLVIDLRPESAELTARTTRARTSPSRSTIRNWPSRGRFR
jgi:dTDP-4-dehydrorhamnose 3,5-epimerase